MREAHRSFRATRQKRPKIDLKARLKSLGAALALGRFTGRVLECLRGGPGTLLDGSWPLLARPGRPKMGFGQHFGIQRPSRARPDASPKRLWTPKMAQDRFFVDFESIKNGFRRYPNDFSSIFVQAGCDEGTKAESLKGVA